jgi:hypothetical protein
MKGLNKQLIVVLIFLCVCSFFYILYRDSVNQNFRDFLEWKNLSICLWLFIFICFSLHYLSVKNVDVYKKDYISGFPVQYGAFSNSVFSAITFGLATTTSVSIMKGIYIQEIFKDKIYFYNFDNIDIVSILVVSLFLFIYSMSNSIKVLYAAIKSSAYENASSPK